jgi:hypothetical protein
MKADLSPVAPVFQKDWHAIVFALLVFLLLGLPLLLAASGQPSKEALFAAVPASAGDFQYLYRQIYQEKSDIDVLFLGSSTLWFGVDVPMVHKELVADYRKDKTVLMLGHAFSGYDLDYYLLKELLSRRKVRLAFLISPNIYFVFSDWPHKYTDYWFTLQDWNMLSGLSFPKKLSMYSQTVLGGLRQLLSLVRPNEAFRLWQQCDRTLGYMPCLTGFTQGGDRHLPFKEFRPAPPQLPAEALFFSSNPASFGFFDKPLAEYEWKYFRQCVDLLHARGIPVVLIHTPYFLEAPDLVTERLDIGLFNDKNTDIMGVPHRVLFNGLDEEKRKLFYFDHLHLNANGAEFFTKAVCRGIVHAYKKASSAK